MKLNYFNVQVSVFRKKKLLILYVKMNSRINRYCCCLFVVLIQIVGLFLLTQIPWPGPLVFKISCPRDNARIVRKIVQTKWIPVLEKYKVKIPIECPFHPKRDIFAPQQAAKFQHRPSQWTCGLCGKSFFEEKYLDMHFDNRHKGVINMVRIYVGKFAKKKKNDEPQSEFQ